MLWLLLILDILKVFNLWKKLDFVRQNYKLDSRFASEKMSLRGSFRHNSGR